MRITSTGTQSLQRTIDNIVAKQAPFAISVALNETAKDVKKGVERQLVQDIDNPTPFTKKAFTVARSTKKNLESAVFVNPIQTNYLRYQILGGKRTARKGMPVLVPSASARLNKYGNIPRNKIRNLEAKDKLYKTGRRLVERMARKDRGLAYSAKSATYKKKFKFYERAKSTAVKTFPNQMRKSLTNALRTARV